MEAVDAKEVTWAPPGVQLLVAGAVVMKALTIPTANADLVHTDKKARRSASQKKRFIIVVPPSRCGVAERL
jgi:hypothetical protein